MLNANAHFFLLFLFLLHLYLFLCTSLLGPGAPQSAIMDVMVSDMELPDKKAALFTKIGESAGIDRRYSVLPTIEAIYFGRKGLGNDG